MNNTPQVRFAEYTADWEQRKLGDHCEMFNGDRSAKYPNAQDMVSEGIPFINAGDLEDGRVNLATANRITREKYNDLGGAKLQLGDIVYCLRGTLGKNAYIDNFAEGTVASSLVAIRPQNIDGRYMFHVLNSDIEYRQRIVHDEGAAQPNLSAKSVSDFVMPVPDIEEQKQISSFLDRLSILIILQKREYEKLVSLKSACLDEMFPKNDSKMPELRFAEFTGDWEQRKLGELTDFVTGKSFSTDLSSNGVYIVMDMGTVSQEGNRIETKTTNVKRNLLNKDDLIMPKDDIGGGLIIGRTAHIPADNQYVLGDHVYRLRFTNENGLFLHYQINSNSVRKRIIPLVTGSAQLGLNSKNIQGVYVRIPSIDEQIKIGDFFANLDNLITLHQRKLEKLKQLKQAMLYNMFV